MKNLLGGKGANIAEMLSAGLPVPPGFTITTEAYNEYYHNDRQTLPELREQTLEAIAHIEKLSGKTLGDAANPLLVSVRSGSPLSMPGMMDTVLNLGLNDDTVEGLATQTGNRWFALDAYRRFISMFARIVLGVDDEKFSRVLERHKAQTEGKRDIDLSVTQLEEVIESGHRQRYQKYLGRGESNARAPRMPIEYRFPGNSCYASPRSLPSNLQSTKPKCESDTRNNDSDCCCAGGTALAA